MIKKLGELTQIDFSKEDGDFATMMQGMRSRQQSGDPSLMMGNEEWKSYSDTDSKFLFWTNETKRKKIKAVDMKLEQFHAAQDNSGRISVLEGSLSDEEISKNLADLDMEEPTKKPKHRTIFERAGLIQLCDLYLLKEDGSSRRDMVAKLRSDSVRELDRLKTASVQPDSRSRN